MTTLTQGNDGFLWIGTQDGLNRYDGSEFVSYHYNPKDTNSLCGNEVNRLFTDSQGRIWIGTVNHGLCFYSPVDDKFVRVYSDKDSLSGLSVTAIISDIAEDHMGRIWIAPLDEGLYSMVPSAKHSNRHSILPFSDSKTIGKEITSILVTNNQELILGNKSGALYIVNLESDHEHFKFQILDFMSTYVVIESERVFYTLIDIYYSRHL